MEVKVSVEGVPLVVCRVTEKTTCQEVVIALAQSLGRPGRYTLKEKFKGFERNVTPNERVLQSLEKYGEQVKEVQLTLLYNGPSHWEGPSRERVGRYQAGPQLRRADAMGKVQSGSGLSLHRQSLPPILRLRKQAEQPTEEFKKPKRKSLTLMEAWGWLESLGKGEMKEYARIKGNSKNTDKRDGSSQNVSVTVAEDPYTSGIEKSTNCTDEQQRYSFIGDQSIDREKNISISDVGTEIQHAQKHRKFGMAKTNAEAQETPTSALRMVDEKRMLRSLVAHQQASLKELHIQITSTERQINELEARHAEQEAQQKVTVAEQLEFWENELKAEEGYEKDLQKQFLEMKKKAVECKTKLEEYKRKMQGLDTPRDRRTIQEEQVNIPSQYGHFPTAAEARPLTVSVANNDRIMEDSNIPPPLIPLYRINDFHPSGACQSEAQNPSLKTQSKVVHRSVIEIHLGSTRV